MDVIKDKGKVIRFDEQIYQTSPLYITCDKYWDGGIRTDSTLKVKAEFYTLATRMSDIIKEIIQVFNEEVIVGKPFCEYEEIYARWSHLKSYELFREISETIRKNKIYKLTLPEDSDIIDLIVESNFRYFTYISLYLPASKIIIQPTCHTEILVYSMCNDLIFDAIEEAVKTHSDKVIEIKVKKVQEETCV